MKEQTGSDQEPPPEEGEGTIPPQRWHITPADISSTHPSALLRSRDGSWEVSIGYRDKRSTNPEKEGLYINFKGLKHPVADAQEFVSAISNSLEVLAREMREAWLPKYGSLGVSLNEAMKAEDQKEIRTICALIDTMKNGQ